MQATGSLREGRVDEARSLIEKALDLKRQIGDRREEALSLLSQARIERLAGGDFTLAMTSVRDAELLCQTFGAKEDRLLAACERGHLALAIGRPVDEALEAARVLAEQIGATADTKIASALRNLEEAAVRAASGALLFRGDQPEEVPDTLRTGG